jgi:hypothetical protein
MAPREGEMAEVAGYECNASAGSVFWSRLNTLPVVRSTIKTTMDLYSTSKERPLIAKGLGVIEYGVNLASTPVKKVATTIAKKYPVASTTVTKLDTLACNCLDTLENKIPSIQKSPTQIVTNVKKGTSTAIHRGVRKMMKTYPGQQMVKGLDLLIQWSEATLDTCSGKTAPDEGNKQEPKSSLTVKLRNGVVVPLKLYLQMLKLVKRMLADMAGVQIRPTSPQKRTTPRRRKVSPRKRIAKQSLVSSLTTSAMSLLGLKANSDLGEQIRQELTKAASDATAQPVGRSEKRKHDDGDAEESESDAETLNLASALDNYDSDLDSDYHPGEVNEDSLEYNSGDTESDLESECVGKDKHCKDFPISKDSRELASVDKKKSDDFVGPS